MIKRELAKDEKLALENWDRFLPKFKKQVLKSKKRSLKAEVDPKNPDATVPAGSDKKEKKEYTPFPPPQQPRKEDLLLESGEYFLKPRNQKERKQGPYKTSQLSKSLEKKSKKMKSLIPPSEKPYKRNNR